MNNESFTKAKELAVDKLYNGVSSYDGKVGSRDFVDFALRISLSYAREMLLADDPKECLKALDNMDWLLNGVNAK